MPQRKDWYIGFEPWFDLLPLIPTDIVKRQQRTMQRISC